MGSNNGFDYAIEPPPPNPYYRTTLGNNSPSWYMFVLDTCSLSTCFIDKRLTYFGFISILY